MCSLASGVLMSSAVSESLRAFFAVFARFENGWQSGVENVGTIRNWTINHFVNDTKYSTQLPEKFPWELLFFVSLKKMSAPLFITFISFPWIYMFRAIESNSLLILAPITLISATDIWLVGFWKRAINFRNVKVDELFKERNRINPGNQTLLR